MRVLNRKQFLLMPAGTVYAKGAPWAFGSLCVKGDSLANDWYYVDPCWIDANDTDEAEERLEAMLHKSASFPMEEAVSRDGMFDSHEVFLVFEKADLRVLHGWVQTALTLPETLEGGKEVTDDEPRK